MTQIKIHHQKYLPVKIKLPNGTFIETRSTYDGDIIIAEVDIFKHPAWKEDVQIQDSINQKVNNFQNKFSEVSNIFDILQDKQS